MIHENFPFADDFSGNDFSCWLKIFDRVREQKDAQLLVEVNS
jgi:hypothetical protein